MALAPRLRMCIVCGVCGGHLGSDEDSFLSDRPDTVRQMHGDFLAACPACATPVALKGGNMHKGKDYRAAALTFLLEEREFTFTDSAIAVLSANGIEEQLCGVRVQASFGVAGHVLVAELPSGDRLYSPDGREFYSVEEANGPAQ